jgi:hypothetical protein
MAPLIAALISAGAPLLANLVKEKGTEYVQEKFGVNLGVLLESDAGKAKLTDVEAQYQIKLLELEQTSLNATLADVQSARARDTAIQAGDSRTRRSNLMFLLAVVVISGIVVIVWKDPDVNEYVKGVLTLVLGRFLGYLDNIYNFEFGSTRTSGIKSDTIAELARGLNK